MLLTPSRLVLVLLFRWKFLTGIFGCIGRVDETEDECSVENVVPVAGRLSLSDYLKRLRPAVEVLLGAVIESSRKTYPPYQLDRFRYGADRF